MMDPLSDQPTIDDLVRSYHTWLRDRTVLKKIRQWTEITTPFLDRHNDYIQIYAAPNEQGGYILSDDAYTLHDLEISGCSLDTGRRKDMLATTLNGFGIRLENGALQVHATADNFAIRKHNLIQAVLAVNDLFYLASPIVRSLFVEDVTAWLDQNDIRYLSRIKFSGKSGFDHVFDYGIPRSSMAPERIIRAVTNPSKESAQNFAFAWHDTQQAREAGAVAYAVLNDNDKHITTTVTDALTAYGIESILWSERALAERRLAA